MIWRCFALFADDQAAAFHAERAAVTMVEASSSGPATTSGGRMTKLVKIILAALLFALYAASQKI
jgi:hypothetical protein